MKTPKPKHKKPTTAAPPPLTAERIVTAGMALAATRGWDAFSLWDVAAELGTGLVTVERICPDKNALLDHLGTLVDEAMLASPANPDDSVRDRLFDLTMRRFDALARWKPGVVAVVRGWPSADPLLPLVLVPSLRRSLRLTLTAAGLPPTPLRLAGFGVVALAALRTWCTDDSADLGTTMALLDRCLAQLERAAEALAPLCPRAPHR